MMRVFIITLLSVWVYHASAMDIEEQILKIRNATDADRYMLVNELKRELSQLGRNERVGAIIALKQQLHATRSDESTDGILVSDTTKSEMKQGVATGQRNILNNFPNVAAVSNAQGSGMVDNVVPGASGVTQVTPPRPSGVPSPKTIAPPLNSIKMVRNTSTLG